MSLNVELVKALFMTRLLLSSRVVVRRLQVVGHSQHYSSPDFGRNIGRDDRQEELFLLLALHLQLDPVFDHLLGPEERARPLAVEHVSLENGGQKEERERDAVGHQEARLEGLGGGVRCLEGGDRRLSRKNEELETKSERKGNWKHCLREE